MQSPMNMIKVVNVLTKKEKEHELHRLMHYLHK